MMVGDEKVREHPAACVQGLFNGRRIRRVDGGRLPGWSTQQHAIVIGQTGEEDDFKRGHQMI